MSTIDDLARASKWLVLRSEEAYGKQLTIYSAVYIFKEANGTWSVWRGNWMQSERKPVDEKTLFSGGTFEQALKRANEYVEWRNSYKRRK
jgi:hypothetical protein